MYLDFFMSAGVAAGVKKAAGPQHNVKDHQLDDSRHHHPETPGAEVPEVCIVRHCQ